MTNPADYLSTEDAERMARAAKPEFWAMIDKCAASPDGDRAKLSAHLRAQEISETRLSWSSRPESARRLDARVRSYALNGRQQEDLVLHVADERGRELLKSSGGNSDEPYDNKSPTGGAA